MSIPAKCFRFQNYNDRSQFQSILLPNQCYLNQICQQQKCSFEQAQFNQQRTYTLMTRHPELFPIISSAQNINLTPAQQRQYSNIFWRRLGSQMTTGANWPGFGATAITGSDVRYTS